MRLTLTCQAWRGNTCAQYAGQLVQTDPSAVFLSQALPILGVFLAFAVGLYMGRMVWS